MRVHIILILCVLITGTVFGQSRWAAGIDIQVGLSGTNKIMTKENPTTGTARFLETKEGLLSSLAGMGVWVAYKMSKRFGLRSSVGYVNSGNQEQNVVFSELLSTGQRTLVLEESISFRQGQLQIPLEIVYESAKGKLRPYLTFGVQTNYQQPSTFFRESTSGNGPTIIEVWNEENSRYINNSYARFQAVASIGLRINDQAVVRLRHTFAKPQRISWTECSADPIFDSVNETFILPCVFNPSYGTLSTHQRLTTLQFSYRIF